MTVKRNAGTIKLNGVSYLIAKDGKGEYTYNRKSTPKAQLTTGRRGTASGDANMIEYSWGADEGMGDAVQTKNRDHYNYAMNLFMEHEGEAVVLPSALRSVYDGVSAYTPNRPPTAVFEIVDDGVQDSLSTYWLQDHSCLKISAAYSPKFAYTIAKDFETTTQPSDAKVFDNVAYIGMGGGHSRVNIIGAATASGVTFTTDAAHGLVAGDLVRIDKSNHSTTDKYNGIWLVNSVGSTVTFNIASTSLAFVAMSPPTVPVTGVAYKMSNRYMRSFENAVWSYDDNSLKSVTAVATGTATGETGKAKFAVASHGYAVGDYVYFTHFLVSGYNSMTPAGISTLYKITTIDDSNNFTVNAMAYTSTSVGRVNRQSSDVLAENLEVVGDLLVRSYEDAEGWKVSRCDVVNSNPMLEANWTAGIGTKSVGSSDSPITDIVAVGAGELVMKAEGVFDYDKKAAAYLNQIPELEEHRHPMNGKNSFEWKGWVYIPTIVGTFRWKNGVTQNVTPGRGGQADFTTPVGPIGAFTGDTERLYGITQPFRTNQPKNIVAPAPTRIYLDATNSGAVDSVSDFGLDPTQDLNGFSAAGYLYLGSTKPWHRMYVEMSPTANSVAYTTTYTGLRIDAAEYWNGSSWTAETHWVDYTRVRTNRANDPSSMGQSGDLWFPDVMPTDWVIGGTNSAGGGVTLNASYYWRRFSFSGAIANSIIIKRIIAGVHNANTGFAAFGTADLQVDHGGAQFVLSMTEEQGKGVVWQTMWGWQPIEARHSDGVSNYWVGGAQPVGCMAIVQPNALRSGPTGTRWLFAGLHNASMMMPLGHGSDPTEDGPFMQVLNAVGANGLTANRKAILVLPDTDAGLPYITKVLQEINFDTSGITVASDIEAFYRADGGAWTTVGDITTLPHRMTAGSEPSGTTFGLAIVITTTEALYATLPRLSTLPSLRLYARPEMSELITMTVELDSETVLPGQSDRRVNKTSYAALKTLQTSTVSVSYSDVDESTDNVHVLQIAKRVIHNAENIPRVVADLILTVVPSA